MKELPNLQWLKWTLVNARAIVRQKTRVPPDSESILKLAKSAELRLVQDGEQLLDVVIESLNRLEAKLRAETPFAPFLWDEREKGEYKPKPKDEGRLSDFIKNHLDEDLVKRGIVVNREVEVRRIAGKGTGERTDIHVDAVVKRSDGEAYDRLTVVIECKGCWNTELNTAMETQLVEQYMDEAKCRHGLYLIGWFNCDLWTKEDYRRRQVPQISIDEARRQFEDQAVGLSKDGRVVRAFVLDTALKSK
jgi:hypothetical protein